MELYEGYREWKAWNSQEFGVCNSVDALYFAAEMERVGIPPLDGLKVLEIGFGNGAFGSWVQERGAHYVGIEAINDLVQLAQFKGWNAYHSSNLDDILLSEGPFHLVIAIDVFEHIDGAGLSALLLQIHEALHPGAFLVARVPSGDSPFARAIQYGDVTHKTVIGSSAVWQLAKSCGLFVEQIREPAFPLLGLGLRVAVRRSAIVFLRNLCFSFFRTVIMANNRAVLTPNILFVLKKGPECANSHS